MSGPASPSESRTRPAAGVSSTPEPAGPVPGPVREGTPSRPAPADASPGTGTEDAEVAPRPWWQIPLALVLGIVVFVAALYLLPGYIGVLSSPPTHGPPPKGELTDLCNSTLGTNCAGNQVPLPRLNSNLSACDQLPHSGPNEQLWLNYSLTARLQGLLLMYASYPGLVSHGASAFLENASLEPSVAWSIAGAAGTDTSVVSVPGTSTAWCLVWWASGGSATLTWTSDVTITFDAPR